MKDQHTLLIVDDNRDACELLKMRMEKEGYRTVLASDGLEAIEKMSDDISAVLMDLIMPRMGGMDALREIRKRYEDAQVIIVTAISDLDSAVEAVKAGAFHYITKPVNADLLVSLVRQAVQASVLKRENTGLMEVIGSSRPVDTFIGNSPVIRKMHEYINAIADLDSTVLITGESGVGKGLVSRTIHYRGARAAEPFVTVSCSAMPRELMEAELFGHEKGAFTGAYRTRPGRLEISDGGTLFLDEIGDMSLDLQPKLLTFLQDRYFNRIGGNMSIEVDVRIVAATNRDLERMCTDGQFRQDLYYRLNVIPIYIPPLRERREDIPLIASHLLDKISQKRTSGVCSISEEAMAAMMEYGWPGNIRELENILERSTAMASDSLIRLSDLPGMITGPPGAGSPTPPSGEAPLPSLSLDELEGMAIRQALIKSNGNKHQAAEMLGISRKSIYNKMKRLGVV